MRCVFAGLMRNPVRSIICCSSLPGSHTCGWPVFGSCITATSAGNSLLFVENVRSSAYREYVHPTADANFTRRMSRILPIRFDITGEQGLPCGNELSWHAIWAIVVATSLCSAKSRLRMKKPRTRPRLIDGKNSSRSRLKMCRRWRCRSALVMIDRFRLNPCADRSFRFVAKLISSTQSWRRSDSLR